MTSIPVNNYLIIYLFTVRLPREREDSNCRVGIVNNAVNLYTYGHSTTHTNEKAKLLQSRTKQ